MVQMRHGSFRDAGGHSWRGAHILTHSCPLPPTSDSREKRTSPGDSVFQSRAGTVGTHTLTSADRAIQDDWCSVV